MSDSRPIPTYPDLAGKVAFVTGGSKGIGAASCRALAANGVKVAVVARNKQAIDEFVDSLTAEGYEAIGISTDASSQEGLAEAVAETTEKLGPIDILLPYAGGFSSFTPIEDITLEEWNQVIDANLTSTFIAVQAVLPTMIERGSGVIVTMSSNGGRYLDKLLTASYAASKAGVIQFTRHIAKELGPKGIRVNSIAPATVRSERIERIMDDEAIAKTAALSPLGTMGHVDDCAFATLYLVSDSASWITGVTLDISGGRIML
jgi:3-oxoacyl-[acyl-carrier protein] reductase